MCSCLLKLKVNNQTRIYVIDQEGDGDSGVTYCNSTLPPVITFPAPTLTYSNEGGGGRLGGGLVLNADWLHTGCAASPQRGGWEINKTLINAAGEERAQVFGKRKFAVNVHKVLLGKKNHLKKIIKSQQLPVWKWNQFRSILFQVILWLENVARSASNWRFKVSHVDSVKIFLFSLIQVSLSNI